MKIKDLIISEVSADLLKSYIEKSLSKGVKDAFDGKGDISKQREAGLNKAMKKVYGEALVGDQKKIDKNSNGKLDANDFKKLRKE
jgi:hypothetical protein